MKCRQTIHALSHGPLHVNEHIQLSALFYDKKEITVSETAIHNKLRHFLVNNVDQRYYSNPSDSRNVGVSSAESTPCLARP